MPSGAKTEVAPNIWLAGLLRTCGLLVDGASPQRRPAAGMLWEPVRRRLRRAGWMHGEGR